MNDKILQFGNYEVTLEELVGRIMCFNPATKQIAAYPYIKLYNCYYICQFISTEMITLLEKTPLNSKKGCDIIDFVRQLINMIPHHECENIYIIISLIDLYREIKQSQMHSKDLLTLKDLTDFLCDVIINYKQIYEQKATIQNQKNTQQQKPAYPQYLQYDSANKKFLVATQRDIRFFDLKKGELELLLDTLFDDPEDEIAVFRTYNYNKQAIIGNQRGQMYLHDMASGDKIHKLVSHTNDITQLSLDYTNKLIASSGYDSTVIIQMFMGHKFETKKLITNCNYGKPITLLEVSVHHNIFITASDNSLLYVWDYEFNRLISSIQLVTHNEQDASPTCIAFINGLGLIMIGASNGVIYLILFEKNENQIDFKCIAKINVENATKLQKIPFEDRSSPQTKKSKQFNFTTQFKRKLSETSSFMLNAEDSIKEFDQNEQILIPYKMFAECQVKNSSTLEVSDCYLYVSLNNGQPLNRFIEKGVVKLIPHANRRANYNPHRISEENFLVAVSKTKVKSYRINMPDRSSEDSENDDLSAHKSSFRSPKQKFSFNSPGIIKYRMFQLIVFKQSIQSSPSRGFQIIEVLDQYVDKIIQAHQKQLTIMQMVTINKNYLVTSSNDSYIKLFTIPDLELHGQLNINGKSPKLWKIQINEDELYQKKILFAMKLIEALLNKYQESLNESEQKLLTIDNLIEILFAKEIEFSHSSKQKEKYSNGQRKTAHHSIKKLSQNLDEQQSQMRIFDDQKIQNALLQMSNNFNIMDDYEQVFWYLHPTFHERLLKPNDLAAHLQLQKVHPRVKVINSIIYEKKLEKDLENRIKFKDKEPLEFNKTESQFIRTSILKVNKPSRQNLKTPVSKEKERFVNELKSPVEKVQDNESDMKSVAKSNQYQNSRLTPMTKTQSTQFYQYANQKNLLKTFSSTFLEAREEQTIQPNKRVLNEVLGNLNDQKKSAQRSRQLLSMMMNRTNFEFQFHKPFQKSQEQSLPLVEKKIKIKKNDRKNMPGSNSVLSVQIPQSREASQFDQKLTSVSNDAKINVEHFMNQTKLKLSLTVPGGEYQKKLISELQVIQDPDFEKKLHYAEQFGLSNMKCKCRNQLSQ